MARIRSNENIWQQSRSDRSSENTVPERIVRERGHSGLSIAREGPPHGPQAPTPKEVPVSQPIGRTWENAVQDALKAIDRAVKTTIDAYATGRAEHEPMITDRLIGAIETEMNKCRSMGVIWEAKTFNYSGPGAQESRFGADLGAVLDIDCVNLKLRTAFLAQAKRLEPDARMPSRECERFQEQCRLMLGITPAAYVFLYSRKDVWVIPALTVEASKVDSPYELYGLPFLQFFRGHLGAFVGDHKLVERTAEMEPAIVVEPNNDAVRRLLKDLCVPRVLYIHARGKNEPDQNP